MNQSNQEPMTELSLEESSLVPTFPKCSRSLYFMALST